MSNEFLNVAADAAGKSAAKDEAYRQRLVFAVDCGSSMRQPWPFAATEEGAAESASAAAPPSFLEAALDCVLKTAKMRVVSRPSDQLAVVLYNTRAHKNTISWANVFALDELRQPDAHFMRTLDRLRDMKVFDDAYGCRVGDGVGGGGDTAGHALRGALRVAGTLFSNCSASSADKVIVLLTNDADPSEGRQEEMTVICKSMVDRIKQQEVVKVMPLPMPHGDSSAGGGSQAGGAEAFFDRVLEQAEHGAQNEGQLSARTHGQSQSQTQSQGSAAAYGGALRSSVMETATMASDMVELLECGANRARTAGQLRWHMAPGSSWVAVTLYTCVAQPWSTSATGKRVKLDRATNKEIVTERIVVSEDTGEMISKETEGTDVKLAWHTKNTGERVVFSRKQLAAIKNPMRPGMHLLGFRPRDWFDRQQLGHVGNTLFMCADEYAAQGSAVAFAALHAAMRARGVSAICLMQLRTNTSPQLVWVEAANGGGAALNARSDDEGGSRPPAMHVYPIPYRDDLRYVRGKWQGLHSKELTKAHKSKQPLHVACPEASAAAVKAAGELVDSHKLKTFDLTTFNDPMQARHYAVLQALALEEERLPPQAEDGTDPCYGKALWSNERRKGAALAFNTAVDQDTAAFDKVEMKDVVKQEKKPGRGGGGKKKKAAVGDGGGGEEKPAAAKRAKK